MPHVVKGMSNVEYHAHSAISKSGLDEIARSPQHYYRKYLDPMRTESVWSDAFTEGSALHALVLEPQNFEKQFAVREKVDGRTKAGKEYLAEFSAQINDRLVIAEDRLQECRNMAASIEAHPLIDGLLDGFGQYETSIFWEWDGVECRCRPDYIRPDGLIIDIKTAQSAQPKIFSRKAIQFRYHVQAGFYSEGFRAAYGEEPKGFVFVAVEKQDPYPVCVFEADASFIQAGRLEAEHCLKIYKHCKQENIWPGYALDNICRLSAPSWMTAEGEAV